MKQIEMMETDHSIWDEYLKPLEKIWLTLEQIEPEENQFAVTQKGAHYRLLFRSIDEYEDSPGEFFYRNETECFIVDPSPEDGALSPEQALAILRVELRTVWDVLVEQKLIGNYDDKALTNNWTRVMESYLIPHDRSAFGFRDAYAYMVACGYRPYAFADFDKKHDFWYERLYHTCKFIQTIVMGTCGHSSFDSPIGMLNFLNFIGVLK